MNLRETADKHGVDYELLRSRLNKYGWSLKRALSEPVNGALTPPKKGEVFGRLTIIRSSVIHYNGGTATFSRCRCACGRIHVVKTSSIIRGVTKSCGCLRSEKMAERNRTAA